MQPVSSPTRLPPHAKSGRDAALDLLRAIALVRVVLWHAFATPWMTFFAAMPVMFFVAGTLLEEPPDRAAHRVLMRRRARRILLPLWVYGAVVAAAGLLHEAPGWHTVSAGAAMLGHVVTWIFPLVDPAGSEWHGGWLSTHLWYLRAYLWILLLLPVLAVLARHARRSLPLIVAAVAALRILPSVTGPGRGLRGNGRTDRRRGHLRRFRRPRYGLPPPEH
jgi:peptidoglycan/LPS O-acetylase OafA/YrhL